MDYLSTFYFNLLTLLCFTYFTSDLFFSLRGMLDKKPSVDMRLKLAKVRDLPHKFHTILNSEYLKLIFSIGCLSSFPSIFLLFSS